MRPSRPKWVHTNFLGLATTFTYLCFISKYFFFCFLFINEPIIWFYSIIKQKIFYIIFVNFDSIAVECRDLVIRYETKFYSIRLLIRSRVRRFGPYLNNVKNKIKSDFNSFHRFVNSKHWAADFSSVMKLGIHESSDNKVTSNLFASSTCNIINNQSNITE